MPDSFFHSDKKRKRSNQAGPSTRGGRGGRGGRGSRGSSSKSQSLRPQRDEDVSSESDAGGGDLDDMDFRTGREDVALSDDDALDENETAAEKRIRLAKGYLAKVKQDLATAQEEADYDAAEIDRDLIASRLQKDIAESEGRIHLHLADQVHGSRSRFLSTPSHPPTSVGVTPTSLFISTKRGVILRYSFPGFQKIGKPFGQSRPSGPKVDAISNGHEGEILCVAASDDGKFLVSGGRDKIVGVWNVEAEQPQWLTGMRGHKDAITSICIPPLDNPSHHIFTASLSRHLALASLSTLSVIDTFFGHQDSITAVSAIRPTAAVTAGSRDRTCRWWKVEEEVQLVLRGGGRTFEGVKGVAPDPRKERLGGGWEEEQEDEKARRIEVEKETRGKRTEFVEGSIDCVCMLDDQHFVSGGDSGSICLWNTGKKKPIFTFSLAHGVDELTAGSETKGPRWITSLTALRGSDLFASGSWDGEIRLWSVNPNLRSFKPAAYHQIPAVGFVNDLRMVSLPPGSIDSSDWRAPGSLKGIYDDFSSSAAAKDSSNGEQDIVLVAALAKEPRLGRWMHGKEVKNGALIVHFTLS